VATTSGPSRTASGYMVLRTSLRSYSPLTLVRERSEKRTIGGPGSSRAVAGDDGGDLQADRTAGAVVSGSTPPARRGWFDEAGPGSTCGEPCWRRSRVRDRGRGQSGKERAQSAPKGENRQPPLAPACLLPCYPVTGQRVAAVSEGQPCNSEAERSKVEGAVRTCTDLTMMLQRNSS
jgi:hypothetical protein